MTYLRRAFKYLIQITLIFVLMIGILMLSGYVSKDISVAFRNGWTSIGYIFFLFAVMSAAYPFFGYGKRSIHAQGDPATHWQAIERAMAGRGYEPCGETAGGGRKFRLSSGIARAMRLWEDRITIEPSLEGFQAEGLVRDLTRAVSSINYQIKQND